MSLRIVTLGGLHIYWDEQELPAPSQSRALLAYLAIERQTTREAVMAVFWPESSEENARHALSQALYRIRQTFGEESIHLEAERIRVAGGVSVDLEKFESAVEKGDYEAALELCRGDLLTGVEGLPVSKGYENWLDARRARVTRLHRRAARAAIDGRVAAADAKGAIAIARRWTEQFPFEDEARHKLIELLVACGERGEALHEYDVYERFLASHDLSPLEETKALAESIRTSQVSRFPTETPRLRPAVDAVAAHPPHASGLPGSFWSELKRRHVVTVTGAYLVLAWGIIQLAATISPLLGLPDWFPTAVVVTAGLALPLVIFFAWAFDITPEGIRLTASATSGELARRSLRSRWIGSAAVIGGLALVAGVTVSEWRDARNAKPLDPDLILVLPFRVIGFDTTLARGMVDLLGNVFTGEGGPRAVDASTSEAVWRTALSASGELPMRAALRAAREVGAGKVLIGSLVTALDKTTVNAQLIDVASGNVIARSSPSAPYDSVYYLLDRMAVELLIQNVGESRDRFVSLTSASVPALREYLQGQIEARRGNFPKALVHYDRALDYDSTFALAALRWMHVNGWGLNQRRDRAERIAANETRRLSKRDSLLWAIWFSPDDNLKWQINQLERAVELYRSDPEFWWYLGDILSHNGGAQRVVDWEDRAELAFQRAMDLGHPYTAEPISHLIGIAFYRQDKIKMRDLQRRLGREQNLLISPCDRWAMAVILGDSTTVKRMRASSFKEFSAADLRHLIEYSTNAGFRLGEAVLASQLLVERAANRGERNQARVISKTLALNRGQPEYAAKMVRELQRDSAAWYAGAIADALFTEGNEDLATEAVAVLAPLVNDSSIADPDPVRGASARNRLCWIETWHAYHGDTTGIRQSTIKLTTGPVPRPHLCLLALDVLLAMQKTPDELATAIKPLAAWAAERATGLRPNPFQDGAMLTLARAYERLGEPPKALEAARRRGYTFASGAFLSSFLREEGRLAAIVGDTAGAVKAYRHYLALRSDAEPAVKPEVARIHAELQKLDRASTDRARMERQ